MNSSKKEENNVEVTEMKNKLNSKIMNYEVKNNPKELTIEYQRVLEKINFQRRTDESHFLKSEYENKILKLVPEYLNIHIISQYVSIREKSKELLKEFESRLDEITHRYPLTWEYFDEDKHFVFYHDYVYPNEFIFDVNQHIILSQFECFVAKYLNGWCGNMVRYYSE